MGIRNRKKKEGEMEILSEEVGIRLDSLDFPLLIKQIPKVEKSTRVKVFLDANGKYYPATKTGELLLIAYVQLGFSFIPIILGEKEERE